MELPEQFQVHVNQITQWKARLLERANEVFAAERNEAAGPDVEELHAKIGQLAMEPDFLSAALGRVGDANVRR